ncbi:hypothetical protein BGZ61DRAFT_460691 [Ilyonectria robusta]|uniref:uncharacterized protein n=1 Tax=Ilyonectria robusta TaxID=1079257 RepID=UPI001E8CAF7F|nr:uncharacterized protein BGZ61DRAFT_460691 [Ilyonectria robusta]KAH8669272.1 hypothetical protein BGZ61DRAFT_460691 [Ilyonectria robusta]
MSIYYPYPPSTHLSHQTFSPALSAIATTCCTLFSRMVTSSELDDMCREVHLTIPTQVGYRIFPNALNQRNFTQKPTQEQLDKFITALSPKNKKVLNGTVNKAEGKETDDLSNDINDYAIQTLSDSDIATIVQADNHAWWENWKNWVASFFVR